MVKVYGTGAFDFRRHKVAEYPVEFVPQLEDKPFEAKRDGSLPSSITLSEIQRDRLTKIAAENWSKAGDGLQLRKDFDPELVKTIYQTELLVTGGRKPVPLQRVMILEVSQYLENYLWPNFDPETSTFEHVMSMVLMVNEKVCTFSTSFIKKKKLARRVKLACLVLICSSFGNCILLAVSRECCGVDMFL